MQIRRTGDAANPRLIKMLLCGNPGAGKTLFSSTAPNPLIVSAEGGMLSIEDRGVPYVEISTSADFFKLVKIFQKPWADREKELVAMGLEAGTVVDTLVIDTIDEVGQIIAKERYTGAKRDALTLQDYGWFKEQMKSLTTALRNLDMHVIMTCHLKSRNDDEGRVTIWPAIDGKFNEAIAGYVDIAVVLRTVLTSEVKNNATVRVLKRYLQTGVDIQHDWVKDRSGKLPIEFPISDDFADDFMQMCEVIWPGRGPMTSKEAEESELNAYREKILEDAAKKNAKKPLASSSVHDGKSAVYEAAGQDADKAQAAWKTAGLDGLDEVTDEQVAQAVELATLSLASA